MEHLENRAERRYVELGHEGTGYNDQIKFIDAFGQIPAGTIGNVTGFDGADRIVRITMPDGDWFQVVVYGDDEGTIWGDKQKQETER